MNKIETETTLRRGPPLADVAFVAGLIIGIVALTLPSFAYGQSALEETNDTTEENIAEVLEDYLEALTHGDMSKLIELSTGRARDSVQYSLDWPRQATTVENVARFGMGVEQYKMDYQVAPQADDIRELQDIFEATEINLNRSMIRDGWGNELIYEHSGVGLYTVMSYGSDNAAGPEVMPDANGELIVRHFDEDIIWSMGRFVQRPEGSQTSGPYVIGAHDAGLSILEVDPYTEFEIDEIEVDGDEAEATVILTFGGMRFELEVELELEDYDWLVTELGDLQPYEEEGEEEEREGTVSSRPTAEGGVWRDRGGLEYVYIPPGSFQMGCVPGDEECEDWESPRHLVTITSGFYMCRTEVTVRAYRQFCDATGRSMPPAPAFNQNWIFYEYPIVNVTWHDAVAYCEWAGARLPTEAEWEYAARGGQEGWIFIWGNQGVPTVNGIKQANVADEALRRDHRELHVELWRVFIFEGYDDGYGATSPVGSFAAHGFGLYDIAGNVWEWCSDWYDSGYYRTPDSAQDPQGPPSGDGRVVRGGSWYGSPWYLRVSYRTGFFPDLSVYILGFRCVRDVE